jgi:hypothetical protein
MNQVAHFLLSSKRTAASRAMDMNRPKILIAPITIIVAHDLAFPETMPKLFPARATIFSARHPKNALLWVNHDRQ